RKMVDRMGQGLVRAVDLGPGISVLKADEVDAFQLQEGAQARQGNGARVPARGLRSSPPGNADFRSSSKTGKPPPPLRYDRLVGLEIGVTSGEFGDGSAV